MSIIRAIKHRLGLSVTPANNFVLDASADNGTMKLARESGQDIMTIDAAGKVAFPAMGQLLSGNGYIKLPGGLIIQWGITGTTANQETVTFPIPFPTACLQAVASPAPSAQATDLMFAASVFTITPSSMIIVKRFAQGTAAVAGSTVSCSWIAIGY